MAHRAVGGVARELDHLLAGERGLADDGLGDALLAQLAQRARRLLLVRVHEDGVGIALLGLQHRRREVELAGVGGDVGHHLHAQLAQRLHHHVAAALAEVVVDVDHRHRLRLQVVRHVARDLRHRGGLAEARAIHVGVALGRDGGGFRAGEVRDLRAPRLVRADDHRAREAGAEHREHVVVDRLLRQALRDARVALRVGVRHIDLLAEDAAGGVDLADGEVHAVLEVGADGGAGAGQLLQARDPDRALRCGQAGGEGERRARNGGDAMAAEEVHACLLVSVGWDCGASSRSSTSQR